MASAKELVPIERWPAWHNAAFVKPGVVATWTRGRTPEEVIAFWNATDGKLLRKHTIVVPESEWWRRELSPDGKLFAAENEKKGVLVFDVESGKQVMQINDPPPEGRTVEVRLQSRQQDRLSRRTIRRG